MFSPHTPTLHTASMGETCETNDETKGVVYDKMDVRCAFKMTNHAVMATCCVLEKYIWIVGFLKVIRGNI